MNYWNPPDPGDREPVEMPEPEEIPFSEHTEDDELAFPDEDLYPWARYRQRYEVEEEEVRY